MAGNKNSGGFRPTAPQNNPANVSATGGAGQSGTQPARYMSGLAYGQGQAQMNQQEAAPMAGNPVTTGQPMVRAMNPVIPLTAPTQRPDVPITNKLDEEPTLPAMVPQQQPDNSAKLIQALYLQDPSNEDVRRMLEYLSAEGRI